MMNVFGFDFTTTIGSFTVRGEYAYFNNKYYMRKFNSVLNELVTTQQRDQILSAFMRITTSIPRALRPHRRFI